MAPSWRRGTTEAVPVRTGASFVGLAPRQAHRVLSQLGRGPGGSGDQLITEITGRGGGVRDGSWRSGARGFRAPLRGLGYDWLDVPALLAGADRIFEYPMIDQIGADRVSNRVACSAMRLTSCIRPARTVRVRRSSMPACLARSWLRTACRAGAGRLRRALGAKFCGGPPQSGRRTVRIAESAR